MMSNYFSLSKNDFYSIIIIAPLFVLYHILGFFNNFHSNLIVKNSADVFIKYFFQYLSVEYASLIYLTFFIAIIAFIMFKNKKIFVSSEIKLSFLFGMIVESILHSLSLLIFMSLIYKLLPLGLFLFNNNVMEGIYLSIGAGIWEELLFRYIMISSLLFIFNKAMYDFSLISYILIIVFASTLFSYYHFIGAVPELINFSIFIYRFVAGIILSVIFIFRGLGIAVYTHTFYDLYLVVFGS